MAQGKDGYVTVYSDDVARLEDGIIVTPHKGTVAEDGTLGRSGRSAGEEDGGGAFRVDIGHGSLRIRDAGGRKHLDPLQLGGKRHELLAHEKRGDIELHAGTDDRRLRQLCREIHRHVSCRSDGKEQFNGVLAVAVEDADVGSLRKAQALDKCAAAGNALSQFFVSKGIHGIGQSRHIGIFLREPVYEPPHGGKVGNPFKLLLRQHGMEVLL